MTNNYTRICFYDYQSNSQERTTNRKEKKVKCHAREKVRYSMREQKTREASYYP